jgi:predicted dithiol-disulfide oxidoreductase (DUF899 family)
MCTALLSAWDGNAQHVEQWISLAVIARSPIERLIAYKVERGWRNLRIFSDMSGEYTRAYLSATDEDIPGIQHLHASRRHDPPFLERRNGNGDCRSRPGSARRARSGAAMEHSRHHAGRPRSEVVSEAQLLGRMLTCG